MSVYLLLNLVVVVMVIIIVFHMCFVDVRIYIDMNIHMYVCKYVSM